MDVGHPARLSAILLGDADFVAALKAVQALGLPEAAIGAGAVWRRVFDHLTGQHHAPLAPDLDVVYYDVNDLSAETEEGAEATLGARLERWVWDVKNQARVHQWYAAKFGVAIDQHPSLEASIATWPVVANAVAVRLGARGGLEVVAPFGLDDLFGLVVRHNPRLVSVADYHAHLKKKDYEGLWPGVRVLV